MIVVWQQIPLTLLFIQIFYGNVELRDIDKTYNLLQVKELSTLWSYFHWEDYVTDMMDLVNVQTESNETVVVRTPDYFSNLTDLYNSTEHR